MDLRVSVKGQGEAPPIPNPPLPPAQSSYKQAGFQFKTVYKLFWASFIAQLVNHLRAMQEARSDSRVGMIPWRRKWQPPPAFLSGESHGQRSLTGYSPWDPKSRTRLGD